MLCLAPPFFQAHTYVLPISKNVHNIVCCVSPLLSFKHTHVLQFKNVHNIVCCVYSLPLSRCFPDPMLPLICPRQDLQRPSEAQAVSFSAHNAHNLVRDQTNSHNRTHSAHLRNFSIAFLKHIPTHSAHLRNFSIALLEHTPIPGAVQVPRSRFAPVKTCNDLLVLRSDVYRIEEDATVQLAKPLNEVRRSLVTPVRNFNEVRGMSASQVFQTHIKTLIEVSAMLAKPLNGVRGVSMRYAECQQNH